MEIGKLYEIYRKHPEVTTDTRTCREGALFFALKGENFDGNKFLNLALEKGCAYAIGDDPNFRTDDRRIILVEDSLQTLQQLANFHRRKFDIPVIGITGTNGKTTTKELCATVLSGKYKVLYTEGNLNNHIGVPLTLLKLGPQHEIAIIEMGASHSGDIKELVDIAEPGFGLITNVGKAHLEGFGSFEGVIRTKGELYDFIRTHGGKIFINEDNLYLRKISSDLQKISYGTSGTTPLWGKAVSPYPFLQFEWKYGEKSYQVQTKLVGEYNLENLMASVCMGLYFDVPDETICRQIENYTPRNNRSEFKNTKNNHLIIDAYNANPSSMRVALDNFEKMKVSPKMVLLGEMKELGKYSKEEHLAILRQIAEAKFDQVILCGENYMELDSLPQNCTKFETTENLVRFLTRQAIKGYYILIKGSRANHLEKVIDLL